MKQIKQEQNRNLCNIWFVSESGAGLSGDEDGKTEVTDDVTVTTRRLPTYSIQGGSAPKSAENGKTPLKTG